MLASAGKLRSELGSRALRYPPATLAGVHVFYSYTYLLTYLLTPIDMTDCLTYLLTDCLTY